MSVKARHGRCMSADSAGMQAGAKEPIFIDSDGTNSPFALPREHAASFAAATHTQPNARFECRPSATNQPFEIAERVWLVAMEAIPAGAEIRVDARSFGSGRDTCRGSASSRQSVDLFSLDLISSPLMGVISCSHIRRSLLARARSLSVRLVLSRPDGHAVHSHRYLLSAHSYAYAC